MLLLLDRPQMTSNHDLAIITLFQSTLEHALDHFLEFWIFEGVRHFLGLLNQPPTPLITLPKTPPSLLPSSVPTLPFAADDADDLTLPRL